MSASLASIIFTPDADQTSSITESSIGSDHSKIHKECSHIVWKHIKQQGKLNSVCSLKMLFCGPPETGKTTAMRRLTNQIRCLESSSPALDSTVLDKPRTVQLIHKSSVLIADNESWNFDESVKEQTHSIYSLIINSSRSSTTCTGSNASTPHIAAADEGDADDSAQTDSEQEAMVASMTRLAQAGEWEEVTKKLSGIRDITILHVIDSGGQPECHEILPLLLDGQVLALIFLDLSKNLNDKHAVSFRSSNRYAAAHSEKFPLSKFTTQEVLHHILTSIMSLQSVDDGSCNSAALLVGTHLDKVSSYSQVRGLNLQIQDAFKPFIDIDLLSATDTENEEEESYIATLNNMTDDQEDIDRLRKLILEVIDARFRKRQKLGIPTGWLLLHLLLRDKYQDQGWCSLADCIATAKLCGIKEEDISYVLDSIHKNYGTLLYYPSVIDYVICDPNVIISPLKSVFEFVFACSSHLKRGRARSIRDTGEITEKDLVDCFEASSCTHLPPPSLIALLMHRYILCEIKRDDKKFFFMPCLLRTNADAISRRERYFSFPAPILFITCRYQVDQGYYSSTPIPLGVFPAVVVDLSGTWNLFKVRFRNQIQFAVPDEESGATFIVELCKYATYIELYFKNRPNTGKILATLCHQVLDSLQRVSEKYTHMKPIKWELGFCCPSSLEEGGNPHPAVLNRVGNAPIVDMTCCLCSLECVYDLEEKHKCWLSKVSILSI